MIVVRIELGGTVIRRTYPDGATAKILSAGTLKVVIPAEFEVPPMGTKEKKDEKIIKTPEKLLGVFNGPYVLSLEDEE